jgi:fructose transport system ATP-binding protein
VQPGEILGIVGDNGAGKSTLLKILSGLARPDAGTIELDGQPVQLQSTRDAREHGIATVYQDLALVDVLDLAANMFIGDVPRRWGLADRKAMERETLSVMRELGVRVGSIRTPVGQLSGGQRQIVAICRAVRLPATSLILLDEPTAALGVRESSMVLDLIRRIRDGGRPVVLISHNMPQVFEIADRIHVHRLGKRVAVVKPDDHAMNEVVALMTGALRLGEGGELIDEKARLNSRSRG